MSSEVQVRVSMNIKASTGNLVYQSQPTAFIGDMAGAKGPVPGALAVTQAGVNVDFSQLAIPTYCILKNLDPSTSTSWIEYGIYDTITAVFYPLGELLPGEVYALRLSRNLQREEAGTGSVLSGTTRLRLKAHGAAAVASVEAFEK